MVHSVNDILFVLIVKGADEPIVWSYEPRNKYVVAVSYTYRYLNFYPFFLYFSFIFIHTVE